MKLFAAPAFLFYLACFLDDLPVARAARFPVRGRMGGFAGHRDGLVRRASISGAPDLSNQGNLQYQTNINVNGQRFQVLIDTGRYVTPPFRPVSIQSTRGGCQLGPVCVGHCPWSEGHWQDRLGDLRRRRF